MSDNWVVQNLENALNSWNEKMSEIWQLVTQSPEDFKGGTIWSVIVNIHGAVKAIGLALLVLFFVVGVMKTCGSFAELKKPEHAIKLFVRFAIAKGVVTYGLELMMALFKIVQGLISTIMNASGLGTADQTVLPAEMVTAIENCGFFESVPLWAVTLIGSLVITVLSFIMIMSVYGRFFKLYLYTDAECRQELHQVVCRRVSGRRGHHSRLCGLFAVRVRTAGNQSRRRACQHGLELYRGTDFQYADSGRRGQDGG